MARLYANENFPLPVVEELQRLGHDVVTIHERGRAFQSVRDEDILNRFFGIRDFELHFATF